MSGEDRSGRDRLEARTSARLDREAGRLADRPVRTGLGYLGTCVLGILALVVVGGVIGFASGWFNTGKEIVGPANVKTQNYEVREAWNGLIVGADNACQASGASADTDALLLEDPALAYAATYRRTWANYNRRMDNAFEAGAIRRLGLSDYPQHVPDFEEAHGKTPNWCAVSEQLQQIGPA